MRADEHLKEAKEEVKWFEKHNLPCPPAAAVGLAAAAGDLEVLQQADRQDPSLHSFLVCYLAAAGKPSQPHHHFKL